MIETLRHFFLPHHTNNYRAKLLHYDFFAIYVVVFFILSLSFRTIHTIDPSILGFAIDIHIDALLQLTNQERQESGLAPLRLDTQLSQAAAGKATDMFAKNYWAHVAPDGTTPWDFINGSGYVYTVAGENLAKNFSDSSGVVEAWMNSPTHRDNVLRNDYQDIGFAVVNGVLNSEETTLVVQMFGKRLSTQQIAQNTGSSATQETTIVTSPVHAEEESMPPPQIASEPDEATPAAEIASTREVPTVPREPTPVPIVGSVVNKPLIDSASLSRSVTLGFASFLILLLTLDGVYIWRRNIVRIGGRNAAHILFLFIIMSIVWFISVGEIL